MIIQGRTQWKLQMFLFLFVCLGRQAKALETYNIQTKYETHVCYNASLEGFKLSATVLQVLDVFSKKECLDACLADQYCRSINYEYTIPAHKPNKCEFLYDLIDSRAGLEANTSFDHAYIIQPKKVHIFESFPKNIYASCKDVFKKNSFATDGAYYLQLNKSSEIYQAYCYHDRKKAPKCGGGAWTLVMKLNQHEQMFGYDSSFWTNKETWNAEAALNNMFMEDEAKLASYHNTPFTKICLVMQVDNKDPKSIVLNYTASSLYSLIADGAFRPTNASRAQWMSLVNDSALQPNCNKEGFNMQFPHTKLYLRIGLVGNNEKDCKSPDSCIGFGIQKGNYEWSSGNFYLFHGVSIETFGLILVQ